MVRGADDDRKAPHGCPPDLIDRLLIVRTISYNTDEIRTIIAKRAQLENVVVSQDGLSKLAQRGSETSLRYALQLLAPAGVLASAAGRSEVTAVDIDECETLFFDSKKLLNVLEETSGYL